MADLTGIQPGQRGTARLIVAAEHTAPQVGSGVIPVLATPVMINLIEAAALAACEGQLPTGMQTLGIRLEVSHTAATPIGGLVVAVAEVSSVNGREIGFSIDVHDDIDEIGRGTHTRVAVTVAKFEARVAKKAEALRQKLGGRIG